MGKNLIIGIVDACAMVRFGIKATFHRIKTEFEIEFKEADSFYNLEEMTSLQGMAAIFLDMDCYLENNEASLRVLETQPELKIILLYNVSGKAVVRSLMNEPVHSFLFKNAPASEYVLALEKVLNDNIYYCSETSKILAAYLHRAGREGSSRQQPTTFTPKERQIIELICQEYTAKEIANMLSLSKRTIENSKIRILQKMQVKNMAGIVAFAYMHNMVKKQVV